MIANKKKFNRGFLMMVTFTIVLILFFLPIFNGHNGLEYLDALYNSISKGSAYYIPGVKQEVAAFAGQDISVELEMATEEQARQSASLFTQAGAATDISGTTLRVSGDLAGILENSLTDADLMYHNDGGAIVRKYDLEERRVVYNWWAALSALQSALSKQENFKAAKLVTLVQNKAVETAYNYYTIEPRSIGGLWGIVLFSLIFYVVYTLWYGFGIMYMFEGIGMKLEH